MNFDLSRGVSRRNFMRLLSASTAAAASLPAFGAVSQQAMRPSIHAPDGSAATSTISDLVIISSNENPLGPSQAALNAISVAAAIGGRYHSEEISRTISVFNDIFGLKRGYSALFPGSGGALDLALTSNLSPEKPLIHGDPSYEQAIHAADTMKAPKFAVPLTSTYAHDVKAMLKAHPSPGAYFIVNPNNPTGTMTPKQDIVWLLKNKPAGSIVIVDEAYHQFSDDDSCIDLVAQDHDIIVTRTFSKIYGMAGLRAGFVVARPDLLSRFLKIAPTGRSLASIPITTAAAARASLLDKDLVPLRKKINADVRDETLEFLTKKGYKVIPGSQTNFFMVDTRRPGSEFSELMMEENVVIGRTWPTLPTYVRVTVGTREEMQKFQSAFVKCIDKAPGAVNNAAKLNLPQFRIPSELNRGMNA